MVLATILGALGAIGGVLALRRAWGGPDGGWAIPLGWGLLAASGLAWAQTTGADVALALVLLLPSLAAYAVVIGGAKLGKVRPRSGKALRPPRVEARPAAAAPAWRVIMRTLYAGPLAAALAFGCAAAFALKAPMAPVDRLILAAFLAPLIWAVGMIWATTDPRLSRIGLGMTAGAALSFAAAML
jgi:hypothetical protein